jgi:hypothetical protein
MPLAGMSSAELAALREAYADAEEWMLEGVCASLDGLRGDRAGVREGSARFDRGTSSRPGTWPSRA